MRTSVVLAALAALGSAVPALASGDPAPTPPTSCARAIVNQGTGFTAGCDTLSSGAPLAGGIPARNLRLTVLNGAAYAEIQCGGRTDPPLKVTLDGPGTATATLVDDGYCWATATVTAPNTSAVVSNLQTYVFT